MTILVDPRLNAVGHFVVKASVNMFNTMVTRRFSEIIERTFDLEF